MEINGKHTGKVTSKIFWHHDQTTSLSIFTVLKAGKIVVCE